MTDDPVELDAHRGMNAQRETEIRRSLHEVQADQAALRERQEELETLLLICDRVSLASSREIARMLTLCDELGRMLRSLIRPRESQAEGGRRRRPRHYPILFLRRLLLPLPG